MKKRSRNVSVVINSRVASVRLPEKLIKSFHGTTLIEIALKKLAGLKVKNKYLATRDKEILDIYEKYNKDIDLLPRTPESVAIVPGPCDFKTVYAHYGLIQTDYIMSLNACQPFWSPLTIQSAVEYFQNNVDVKTLTSARKSTNIFFDSKQIPINLVDRFNVSTKWNDPIFEMAHMFHIFDKSVYLETGNFWDYSDNNPKLFEVPRIESFDVDNQSDFDFCLNMYKSSIEVNNA